MATRGRLDKPTLDTLRQVYRSGVKVEAVHVSGIPEGKTGSVKRVETNGDILLRWDTGEDCTVLYGKETVRVLTEGLCMIGKSPSKDIECSETKCERCGWNKQVAEERKRRMAEDGLVKGKDGLMRVKIYRRDRSNVS